MLKHLAGWLQDEIRTVGLLKAGRCIRDPTYNHTNLTRLSRRLGGPMQSCYVLNVEAPES
jgi:hypothetical protein